MEYTHLGRSGLLASRLALGTMNFGPATAEDESHSILDRALDAGINLVDTANVYGWGEHKGRTEEIIGHWLAADGGRRDKVVLATKVYGSMSDWPNDRYLSARNIRQACDASLRRLRTDRIDLYQFHHVDRATPWDEIWQAVDTLVTQGKVLYTGSSNFAGWHVVQAQETARARDLVGLVSEQALYNLCERRVELELLPACQAYGVGLLPWSPLHGGVLGGVLAKENPGRSAEGRAARYLAAHRDRIEAYEGVCRDLGHPPAEVALAWLLHREGVTAPVVGPRSVAQLDSALAALDLRLEPEVLARLDEVFPGPGGQAPEAYAW